MDFATAESSDFEKYVPGLGSVGLPRDFVNVIVVFEAPADLLANPNARAVMNDARICIHVFIRGCKSCQKVLTKCVCASGGCVEREICVYNRALGLNRSGCELIGYTARSAFEAIADRRTSVAVRTSALAIPKTTPAPKPSANAITVGDILELLAGSSEHEDGPGTREAQIQNCQELPPVSPALLDHINRNRAYLKIYFSYPESKSEAVQKLWQRQKRVLDIRPIANPDTDRGGCGCSISMQTPSDLSVLENYPAALKAAEEAIARRTSDGQKILMMKFGDVRLGLQLVFQHGFEISGATWSKAGA
jgi:hypothetical protein